MTHERVGRVLAIAAAHHGLVTVAMLAAAGIDQSAADRLTRAGVLEPFAGRGIRRVASGEPTPHQALLGAVWAAGPDAVASHRAAAWLWSLDPIDRPGLEVVVPPRCGRRPAGVRLHYSSDHPSGLTTSVDGIPVTEATLTLIDLASVLDKDTLECAFDSALRQGLTSLARARSLLDRVGRRGRNGTARFRAVVEAREVTDGVAESVFETRLLQVLRRGGLPEPVRQVEVADHAGFIGRFDCGYPAAMVLIEADSVRHHHSRARFEADRERRARVEALGWRVLSFTWSQATRRPGWVAEIVSAALDASPWEWRAAAS